MRLVTGTDMPRADTDAPCVGTDTPRVDTDAPCTGYCRNYIAGRMTKRKISVIVITVRKQSGPDGSRKEKIMATVNFAANGLTANPSAYYLHSEHYEALFSKEKEQSHVKMRSCEIRKGEKLCDTRRQVF